MMNFRSVQKGGDPPYRLAGVAQSDAQGLVNPVFADIEDDVKGLGVLRNVGLERVE